MSKEKLFEIIDTLLNIGQYGIACEIAYYHDLGLDYIQDCYRFKLKEIQDKIKTIELSLTANTSQYHFLMREESKIKRFLINQPKIK